MSLVSMNWLSFVICFCSGFFPSLFFGLRKKKQAIPKVYISFVIVLCRRYCLCNTSLHDAECDYMALVAARESSQLNSFLSETTSSCRQHSTTVCQISCSVVQRRRVPFIRRNRAWCSEPGRKEGLEKEKEKLQNQRAVFQMYSMFVVLLLHLSLVYDLSVSVPIFTILE